MYNLQRFVEFSVCSGLQWLYLSLQTLCIGCIVHPQSKVCTKICENKLLYTFYLTYMANTPLLSRYHPKLQSNKGLKASFQLVFNCFK